MIAQALLCRVQWLRFTVEQPNLSRGYTSDFLLAMVMRFFEIIASPARGENRKCSHPLTKTVILMQKIQLIEFLAIFFCDFSSVASPVRGWLHMRFSPRTGDATIFQKIASPSQAKNRSCSRGFIYLNWTRKALDCLDCRK